MSLAHQVILNDMANIVDDFLGGTDDHWKGIYDIVMHELGYRIIEDSQYNVPITIPWWENFLYSHTRCRHMGEDYFGFGSFDLRRCFREIYDDDDNLYNDPEDIETSDIPSVLFCKFHSNREKAFLSDIDSVTQKFEELTNKFNEVIRKFNKNLLTYRGRNARRNRI